MTISQSLSSKMLELSFTKNDRICSYLPQKREYNSRRLEQCNQEGKCKRHRKLSKYYLTKHINMIVKTQRSFTRYISGMQGLSYPERLTVLKMYSLQRIRERYIFLYVWTIFECQVHNFSPPIRTRTFDRRGRSCITSHVRVERSGILAYNMFRWVAIRQFNQLPLFLRNTTVLFIASRRNWIYIYLQCPIFHVNRDLPTSWTMETV